MKAQILNKRFIFLKSPSWIWVNKVTATKKIHSLCCMPYLPNAKYDQTRKVNPTVFYLVTIHNARFNSGFHFEKNTDKWRIWKPYYIWNC